MDSSSHSILISSELLVWRHVFCTVPVINVCVAYFRWECYSWDNFIQLMEIKHYWEFAVLSFTTDDATLSSWPTHLAAPQQLYRATVASRHLVHADEQWQQSAYTCLFPPWKSLLALTISVLPKITFENLPCRHIKQILTTGTNKINHQRYIFLS